MVALGQDAAPRHASAELKEAYTEGVGRLFSTFMETARADPSSQMP
jgi:TetR/AcrR family transcriptional regulator, transcriptional repressor for nem operon